MTRQEYKRDWQAQARARNRAVVDAHLSASRCVDCGQSFPAPAMKLIQVDGRGIPYRGILHNLGSDRLQEELARLAVVCRNCHSLR